MKRSTYLRWLGSALALSVVLFPGLQRRVAGWRLARRLSSLTQTDGAGSRCDSLDGAALSLRVQHLGPLLATWETIGGCGAGGTVGSGAQVKWIGHNVTGGLFHTQLQVGYMPVQAGMNVSGGYNLIGSLQLDKDFEGTDWNGGVTVPFLYKQYNDYYQLPVDVSNTGFGDVGAFLTRRLGTTNATSLTFNLGLPTGTHRAEYKMDYLTQEKQLGFGTLTAGLTLEHIIDETWGLFLVGSSLNYRGGTNELGSYRAPSGSLYGFAGYFFGPFVPAIGLTATAFTGKDQDRGLEQDVPIATLAPSASVEWAIDDVAALVGISLPFSLDENPSLQPWVFSVGVAASPF